jgi:hypothetical protein
MLTPGRRRGGLLKVTTRGIKRERLKGKHISRRDGGKERLNLKERVCVGKTVGGDLGGGGGVTSGRRTASGSNTGQDRASEWREGSLIGVRCLPRKLQKIRRDASFFLFFFFLFNLGFYLRCGYYWRVS